LRVYLDRFLNIPAARLPDERSASPRANRLPLPVGDGGAEGQTDSAVRPAALLELLDREQQVSPVAALVDAALAAGHAEATIRVLGHALLREDADFHGYQTLEAGVRQFGALRERYPLAARRTLVAVSRFVAAHAPTSRSLQQTYQIAVRLLRGDDLTVSSED